MVLQNMFNLASFIKRYTYSIYNFKSQLPLKLLTLLICTGIDRFSQAWI